MKYFLSIIISVFIIFGCKEKKQKSTESKPIKPKMSIVVNHKKPTDLQPKAKEKLKDWKEYTELKTFFNRFENISPKEALSNASELKTLIKNLKNNMIDRKKLIVKEFNSDAFRARVNVLENEVLRLNDMSSIPSITAKEVNFQVDKIYLIFGSLNAKINTIFVKNKLYNETNLDNFFSLDTL